MKHQYYGSTAGLTAGLIALAYIEKHPGGNTAEVDRARRTAEGGHRWMYNTVNRLWRRRLILIAHHGNMGKLYSSEILETHLAVGLRALSFFS